MFDLRREKIFLSLLLVMAMMGWNGSGNVSRADNSTPSSTSKMIERGQPGAKVRTEDLSRYFTGYDGCFILMDKNRGVYSVYHEAKSKKRVPPCSTFKIINALIGLETGVLHDENTTFPWDGTQYPIETWNHDQTLASAVSNSVVWYFKQVASQIGPQRMQRYLKRIHYGNQDISGGITQFWLQSSLKISPGEQVEMLRNFYGYKLPFLRKNVDVVKKVLILAKQNGIVFSGKTGSGVVDQKYVNGWFIGYVERDHNVYFFATNIEAAQNATGEKAKGITMRILQDKHIL